MKAILVILGVYVGGSVFTALLFRWFEGLRWVMRVEGKLDSQEMVWMSIFWPLTLPLQTIILVCVGFYTLLEKCLGD